jgi:putative nucleotidyltransferase with HDIG domain
MLTMVGYLKPGMILNEDVYTTDGNLLVPREVTLTQHIIKRIQSFDIKRVNIQNGYNNESNIQRFSEMYEETLGLVENTFKTARSRKAIQITDFENVIESIMDKAIIERNVLAYMKLIKRKDEYTIKHSINVGILSMLMGKWVGYNEQDIKKLGLAAILHDIGKVMIPDSILNKPGRLTGDEYSILKNHTRYGFQILKNSGIVDETVINIVLTHHEKINGKGYPFGLSGSSLNEKSRIVSICDIYDAVTSDRVYRKKENPLKGFDIIVDGSYKGLDPFLTRLFIENSSLVYCGSKVILSNGRVGKIVRIPPQDPLKPWITLDNQLIDLKTSSDIKVVDII